MQQMMDNMLSNPEMLNAMMDMNPQLRTEASSISEKPRAGDTVDAFEFLMHRQLDEREGLCMGNSKNNW